MNLFERLLAFYNIDEAKYQDLIKDVSLATFYGDHSFNNIDNSVALVKDTMSKNENIVIYGDYDADGIMGTSILVKMFGYLNYQVSYYLPNRYKDGYGITLEHAKEFVEAGFGLVITVDNGISAFEPIKYLKEHGVKVLILDHHQVQEEIPEVDAICHPIYSKFGDIPSSGAFTAFMFSIALLERVDEYLAVLASISVISDMMPLQEYNRDLLRSIFKSYRKGSYLQIDLLSDNEGLNENIIGMKISPRINSLGRLIDDFSINEVVRFFITDDNDFILNYFKFILENNEVRKEISKDTGLDFSYNGENSIVIKGKFKEGIIGLIAQNLSNTYHVPTVVFTDATNDELKGSARSPEGFNIAHAFEELSDVLVCGGGHASAGGCSIKKDNFDSFKAKFFELVDKNPVTYVEHPAIDVNLSDLSFENCNLINTFAPFGEGWPAPLLRIRHVKTSSLTFSRDQKHILTNIGMSLRIVGFNFPKTDVIKDEFVNMEGYLSKGSYKGKSFIEYRIKNIIKY